MKRGKAVTVSVLAGLLSLGGCASDGTRAVETRPDPAGVPAGGWDEVYVSSEPTYREQPVLLHDGVQDIERVMRARVSSVDWLSQVVMSPADPLTRLLTIKYAIDIPARTPPVVVDYIVKYSTVRSSDGEDLTKYYNTVSLGSGLRSIGPLNGYWPTQNSARDLTSQFRGITSRLSGLDEVSGWVRVLVPDSFHEVSLPVGSESEITDIGDGVQLKAEVTGLVSNQLRINLIVRHETPQFDETGVRLTPRFVSVNASWDGGSSQESGRNIGEQILNGGFVVPIVISLPRGSGEIEMPTGLTLNVSMVTRVREVYLPFSVKDIRF